MLKPKRLVAEKTYTNIVKWSKKEQGGHLAALENPTVLAKEFIDFANYLTSWK